MTTHINFTPIPEWPPERNDRVVYLYPSEARYFAEYWRAAGYTVIVMGPIPVLPLEGSSLGTPRRIDDPDKRVATTRTEDDS